MFNILAESLFTASRRTQGHGPRPAEKRIQPKGRQTTAPTTAHRMAPASARR